MSLSISIGSSLECPNCNRIICFAKDDLYVGDILYPDKLIFNPLNELNDNDILRCLNCSYIFSMYAVPDYFKSNWKVDIASSKTVTLPGTNNDPMNPKCTKCGSYLSDDGYDFTADIWHCKCGAKFTGEELAANQSADLLTALQPWSLDSAPKKCTCGLDSITTGGRHSSWCDKAGE